MEKMHFDGHLVDNAPHKPDATPLGVSAMRRRVSVCASDYD